MHTILWGDNMAFDIKLETFEGPLDLLLHLIKSAKVDIYDIPIAEITDQYIAYIDDAHEINLDNASEFLIMAATLLEIKSRMLLPKQKQENEDEEEDPRKELVEKLVEYKKYKEFAKQLKSIEENNVIYFKEPELIDDIKTNEFDFKNVTVEGLMFAFKKVLSSYKNKFNKNSEIPKNINYDEYKIEDKINYITDILENEKNIKFSSFFENCESKMELIVTFLAVLELVKLKYIAAYQKDNFDEIIIEKQEKDASWKIS